MNSERMIKEVRYLRNRKIVKVRESVDGHFCLHFEDGNFCIFGSEVNYSECGSAVEFLESLDNFEPETLHEMDIVSDKEFESLMKAMKARRDRYDRDARRKQYESLKAEFEGSE